MIVKGKFPWYDPQKPPFQRRMSQASKSVFNKVASLEDLPHIPTSVLELQQLIGDPNTNSKQLSDAIRKDPVLASRLFRMANRLIDQPKDLSSLEHVITYLGRTMVQEIVTTAALTTIDFEGTEFNRVRFWNESLTCGLIGEEIAKMLNMKNKDEVWLNSALANSGKIIQAICYPYQADRIYQDTVDPDIHITWTQSEVYHKVHTHTILGEIAGSIWGFADSTLTTMRYHHSPFKIPEPDLPYEKMLWVCSLANQMTQWILLQPTRMDKLLLHQLSEALKLTEGDLEDLAERMLIVVDEQKFESQITEDLNNQKATG